MIVYEAPHHLLKTLRELLETMGNRRLTLCRELTKKHETAWQTTLEDAIARYEQEDPKGECVLVIEGRSQKEIEDEAKAAFEEISIEEHMKRYEDQGIARKEAMKLRRKRPRGDEERYLSVFTGTRITEKENRCCIFIFFCTEIPFI